jgi:hypothetical protein
MPSCTFLFCRQFWISERIYSENACYRTPPATAIRGTPRPITGSKQTGNPPLTRSPPPPNLAYPTACAAARTPSTTYRAARACGVCGERGACFVCGVTHPTTAGTCTTAHSHTRASTSRASFPITAPRPGVNDGGRRNPSRADRCGWPCTVGEATASKDHERVSTQQPGSLLFRQPAGSRPWYDMRRHSSLSWAAWAKPTVRIIQAWAPCATRLVLLGSAHNVAHNSVIIFVFASPLLGRLAFVHN